MHSETDVIIVGSGLAGVSAAFPLVEAGLKVLMLDTGFKRHDELREEQTYHQIRTEDPNQWRMFVGKDLSALDSKGPSSPKFRSPGNRFVFSRYLEFYETETRNFVLTGSLAAGGMSNAWGAGICCFDEEDLKQYPINAEDLSGSYKRVAERIGVSGSMDDDMAKFHGQNIPLQAPLDLGINSERLLSRYTRNPRFAWARGVRLGRSRHAVLTRGIGQRKPCNYCGLCMWGCAQQSIYSAGYDLEALKKYPNFNYRNFVFVKKLEKKGTFYDLVTLNTDSKEYETIPSKRLILACGAIGSAQLVLNSLKMYERDIQFFSNPMVNFAVSFPERVGQAIPEHFFPMGHLSYRVDDPECPENYAFGGIISADAILASEIIRYMPLSFPVSRRIFRALQSSLLLGNCFLSGGYGKHKMRITPEGKLKITGIIIPEMVKRVRFIRKSIAAAMLCYGGILLPGGFRLTQPGEDMHYAGTLPMRHDPEPHELNPEGEVRGLPGVYVVDGAALTALPSKSHSFTIMANSDRIARRLAGTLRVV